MKQFYLMHVIMSMIDMQSKLGVKKMIIPLTIRYDERIHRKMKIIAAFKNESLSKLLLESFDKTITDWEREHGEIKIPE